MTYDLRRLHRKGILLRLPTRHRYVLTPLGRRVALFFPKTDARILRPGLARLDPDAPANPNDPLARAWRTFERALGRHIAEARMAA